MVQTSPALRPTPEKRGTGCLANILPFLLPSSSSLAQPRAGRNQLARRSPPHTHRPALVPDVDVRPTVEGQRLGRAARQALLGVLAAHAGLPVEDIAVVDGLLVVVE